MLFRIDPGMVGDSDMSGEIHSHGWIRANYEPGLPLRTPLFRNYVQKYPNYIQGSLENLNSYGFTAPKTFSVALQSARGISGGGAQGRRGCGRSWRMEDFVRRKYLILIVI